MSEILSYDSLNINKWLEKDTSLLLGIQDVQLYSTLSVDPETGEPITNQVSAGLTTINTEGMTDAEISAAVGKVNPTNFTSGDISQPINLVSGYIQSANFITTSTGWQINADGDVEFNSGTFRGTLVAGSIHIPNQNTTANSFHTDSDGNSWWGCTNNDFTTDNDNALAYILATGAAKFQSISVVGGIIDGTTTLGGRVGSTIASAIDVSGHFADDAISTATGTIIGDFTFTPTTGGLQIGTYVNGASGDIRISESGLLGRDKTGATTFSINATTGVAVLNGLVVGTNVGIGTAQTAAQVTTIVGDTVTTSYVNALNITAQYVAASIAITSPTITGGTLQTATGTGARIVLDTTPSFTLYDSSNRQRLFMTGSQINFKPETGNEYIVGASDALGLAFINDSHALIILDTDALYTGYSLDLGKTASRWNNVYIGGTITMNNSKILALATPTAATDAANKSYVDGEAFACSDLSSCNLTSLGTRQHAGLTNVTVNQHHSSTSNGLAITPSTVVASGAGSFAGLTVNGNLQPNTSNSRHCGTSGAYWARVYSDAYFTKNMSFQSFDKYNDLQILRDLKFGKKNELLVDNLPKEIAGEGFINFGGMTSFNLCASKKIVEYIDDFKNKIDVLEKKINKFKDLNTRLKKVEGV